MRAFIPVTAHKHTRVAGVRYSDMLTAGAIASIMPIRGLKTELSYTAALKPNTAKRMFYTGSEVMGKISHRLYSDIEASLTGGAFIVHKKDSVRWLAELSCTVHL